MDPPLGFAAEDVDDDADFDNPVAPPVALGDCCFTRSEQMEGVRLNDFSINFWA